MRAPTPILAIVGFCIVATVALSGCGAGAPATPTSAPAAAAATAAPASPTAVPATATVATTTGESLKSTVATSTPAAASAGESLKPATPTAGGSADSLKAATATPSGQQPAVTPASVRDSLKPIETPKPVQPTQPPAKAPSDGKIKPVTKLQVQPTPVPPARKGVANSSVDPTKYAQEMVADLEQLAGAVQTLGDLANAYDADDVSEDELVAGFNKQAGIVRAVYQREVQRDYPPKLKEIDDYYVESLRSATKMTDSLVLALQTGDEKYLVEAQQHAQKFEYFFNELAKRLQ